MARTGAISIPSGLETSHRQSLQSGDRFGFSSMKSKGLYTSRNKLNSLYSRSLLVQLKNDFALLSDAEKLAWNNAGAESSMTGWRLFIQDTASRLASGLSGFATPSTLHQNKCGKIEILSPASSFKIFQNHSKNSLVNKKVVGTRSQFTPYTITENLTLPFNLAISFKSDLVATGDSPFAKFYLIIYSLYQGLTIPNICEISFPLSHDWQRLTASISSVNGTLKNYCAYIEIFNARGTLLFDNIEITHDGLNYCRDPFCNDISKKYKKAFKGVSENWTASADVVGASFSSIYPA